MKTIVLYKSHTGHTQQYAKMIAGKLDCESIDMGHSKSIDLNTYDLIIYGGCVRASKISGLNTLLKRLNLSITQKVILFAVGGNPISEENTEELKKKNLEDMDVDYPLFYLQGGFDPDKLNFVLKKMLKGVAKSIKKKQEKDPDSLSKEDRDFLEFFQEKHTDVDDDNLKALLEYISLL